VINLPRKHFRKTRDLAASLNKNELYKWLLTIGYYPENYVLPPVFNVSAIPRKKRFYSYTPKTFRPPIFEQIEINFPKTELADRTFGIIEPTIHNDIAYEIAENWDEIVRVLFNTRNRVYSYSFPISIDATMVGHTSTIRSGRMIYEFLEMAEHDLVSEAYRYKYLVVTDIKNFYPSIYTHSIAWAAHGKGFIRQPSNRNSFAFYGNRLDKLFQNSNDGCTNGIAIGPAVSDLIAELILAAIDIEISKKLKESDGYLCVRFKDDYRILCKDENQAQRAIKVLQEEFKQYKLSLNESKTEIKTLPEGLFRKWVGEYLKIKPVKGDMTFNVFKEFYLNVIEIDKRNPNTGVIDRFLADLRSSKYELYIPCTMKDIDRSISLLLLLAEKRIKAFPSILAIIETIFSMYTDDEFRNVIEMHLNTLLERLVSTSENSRYLITWIIYFLKSNKLAIYQKHSYSDPILNAVNTNRKSSIFNNPEFVIFRSIAKSKRDISMMEHIDVFRRP
jgi:hypothetical protein